MDLGERGGGERTGRSERRIKKKKKLLMSLTKSLSYISKEHWLCFPPGSSIKMIF